MLLKRPAAASRAGRLASRSLQGSRANARRGGGGGATTPPPSRPRVHTGSPFLPGFTQAPPPPGLRRGTGHERKRGGVSERAVPALGCPGEAEGRAGRALSSCAPRSCTEFFLVTEKGGGRGGSEIKVEGILFVAAFGLLACWSDTSASKNWWYSLRRQNNTGGGEETFSPQIFLKDVFLSLIPGRSLEMSDNTGVGSDRVIVTLFKHTSPPVCIGVNPVLTQPSPQAHEMSYKPFHIFRMGRLAWE